MPKAVSPLRAIIKALGFVSPLGESHKEQFQYAIKTAHAVAERQPRALADLVRLLARPAIAKRMAASALFNEHVNPRHFPEDTTMVKQIWFDPWKPVTVTGQCLDTLKKPIEATKDLFLGRDLVIPFPWHADRFPVNLALRGSSNGDPWRQDHNHCIILWLPLGIAWVTGGNHSITAGIIQGEGSVTAREVYNISAIYDHVTCDGETFRTTHDNQVIAPARMGRHL